VTTGALSGRLAIITGGGRGIGEAIALRFAAEGARLALAARSRSELERAAASCRDAGADCSIHVVDVSVRDEVRDFVHAAGPVDVLVNCAGVYGPIGPLVENDMDEWERGLRTNLMGTVYACQAVIPGMVQRGRGSIINLSGGGATAPLPNFSLYAVSKVAVARLTDTLAAELAGTGVRVNAIAPGAIDTRLQDEVLAAGDRAGTLFQRMREMRDTGRGATQPDVPARLALFLASDASGGLTGKLISAPHDPWESWDASRIQTLNGSSWYTIRRLDPFTIGQLGVEP
jgi:NAD(P)-dependent dehydrogenase (short-subunit alcohol dehydrogenase family)